MPGHSRRNSGVPTSSSPPNEQVPPWRVASNRNPGLSLILMRQGDTTRSNRPRWIQRSRRLRGNEDGQPESSSAAARSIREFNGSLVARTRSLANQYINERNGESQNGQAESSAASARRIRELEGSLIEQTLDLASDYANGRNGNIANGRAESSVAAARRNREFEDGLIEQTINLENENANGQDRGVPNTVIEESSTALVQHTNGQNGDVRYTFIDETPNVQVGHANGRSSDIPGHNISETQSRRFGARSRSRSENLTPNLQAQAAQELQYITQTFGINLRREVHESSEPRVEDAPAAERLRLALDVQEVRPSTLAERFQLRESLVDNASAHIRETSLNHPISRLEIRTEYPTEPMPFLGAGYSPSTPTRIESHNTRQEEPRRDDALPSISRDLSPGFQPLVRPENPFIVLRGAEVDPNDTPSATTDLYYTTSIANHLLLSTIQGWKLSFNDSTRTTDTEEKKKLCDFKEKIMAVMAAHPAYRDDPDQKVTRQELISRLTDMAWKNARVLQRVKHSNQPLEAFKNKTMRGWFRSGIDSYTNYHLVSSYRQLTCEVDYGTHINYVANSWRNFFGEKVEGFTNFEDWLHSNACVEYEADPSFAPFFSMVQDAALFDTPPECMNDFDKVEEAEKYITAMFLKAGRPDAVVEMLGTFRQNRVYPHAVGNLDHMQMSHARALIKKYSLSTNVELRRYLDYFADQRGLETRCFGFPREDGLEEPFVQPKIQYK
ncbi:hypothetical protein GLAREA_05994 [Glarea lozoyensis ATCC 20868]|uniref:Uncharacterized protein n=1 Tax=Glarea lozoyensis (strain ATCC 20868 / MF5171) TaxID=1116229 RepID=S3D3B5_GLAL2|nr:uncharacterized protein GLAREA_05994 [Glarea lozoyensis ATCC 20868]EPE32982.1 hypothetical protein GLAREA_05994 [Glarea lozoyensis ATCC 20868]